MHIRLKDHVFISAPSAMSCVPTGQPLHNFGFLEGEAVLKTLQLYVAACAACGFGYGARQNAHLKYSFSARSDLRSTAGLGLLSPGTSWRHYMGLMAVIWNMT